MATSTTRRARPVRTLVILAVLIVAVFAALFTGIKLDPRDDDNPTGAALTPGLALDLEGGTQVILQPVLEEGQDADLDTDVIDQAISVIRQRIDSSGVAEAEITRQGQSNIVVGIPGEASQETLDLVKTSAQMRFRPVLTVAAPQATTAATDTPTDGSSEATTDGEATTDEVADPGAEASQAPAEGAEASPAEEAPADGEEPEATPSPSASTATTPPANPSDLAQITPELQAEFDALDCTDPANLVGGGSGPMDGPFVACAQDGTAKYILGPVEVDGRDIASADSGLGVSSTGTTTNEWVVNIRFNSKGTDEFAEVSERLIGLSSPQNQFGIVLDGLVVSAPQINQVIPNGQAQISGSFTRQTSATLANQLNFGALPMTFEVQSEEQISATLGTEQLEKGLIAGLIGLLLVVLYSLVQYRALGLVTVASLTIAAVITYGVIAMLSWLQGYRLSLPGVAGIIVAIGITADSFIVYFERIRDELRDGRTLNLAVDRGWERARRTILASDTVNFLAAIVLYLLAVGGVRGFAFTLGLTTLVDLVVVFMFTHPIMQLLARTRFFADGHPASGLDPRRLGATRYAGRGRVSTPSAPGKPASKKAAAKGGTTSSDEARELAVSTAKASSGPPDDGPRMTIAERRAAQKRADAGPVEADSPQGETPTGDDDATGATDAPADANDEEKH